MNEGKTMVEKMDIFQKYIEYPTAIYGLSEETCKVLHTLHNHNIIGLLDSFQSSGQLYGKKIISLDECIRNNVRQLQERLGISANIIISFYLIAMATIFCLQDQFYSD